LYDKLFDQTLMHNPIFFNRQPGFSESARYEDNPKLIFFAASATCGG
jgi:hypothetical protein